MIIVKLLGGLGNQMFQYAAARSLSLHHNCELKLDTEDLLDRSPKPSWWVYRDFELDLFNVPISIATKKEVQQLSRKFSNRHIKTVVDKLLGKRKSEYKEPFFHFDEAFFSQKPPLYLDGYWQSEKYFSPYAEQIRRDFTFKTPISGPGVSLAANIDNVTAVCVNVRRGDFVVNPVHGTTSTSYYSDAEKIIESSVKDPHYFVFSDDVQWCRENLRFNGHVTFVGHEYAGSRFNDYLQLMIRCKHFIIPNSSFGWWAAWMSENTGKQVIAPKKWFNDGPQDTHDVTPASWTRL